MRDLSQPTIQAYRQTHATLNPGHHWSELDDLSFLKEVRAWNTDRETGEDGPTVAGLLMFGKFQSIQDEFPHYALDYQERPEAKTEKRWIDRVWLDGSWSGNLYDFYRKVYPKLTAELKIPFALQGGLRDEDTPVHEAIREALANTLIHADYRHRTRLLVVKRPDMFDFQNPGNMRIPIELALRGDEPDSRNKRLAHLFGFIRIGEKAGTGIPKIMAGWKSQHWRQPSLTEAYEPSPRTLLRLQMLDLFPPGVLDILRDQFGKRFESLDETGRLALATTLTERRLTHTRLSELTEFHPSDVTKSLRNLVSLGFLVPEGTGRGTVYRFMGTRKISSEDVFSDLDSPNLDTSSPNLSDTVGHRDEQGRLISTHFSLPFVDGLEHLQPVFLQHLEQIAELPRTKRKIDRSLMDETIIDLCSGHYIRLDSLASIVDRKPGTLQGQYLTQLCRKQKLRMAFPDKPNDPRQAYTKF